MEQSSDDQQQYLIAELEKAKIKHNPANIVKIAKQITGKIMALRFSVWKVMLRIEAS